MTAASTQLNDESRLRRNPDIISSQIDGETVMMDAEFDSYFGMAKVGTFIWSQLEEEITFGELIRRLIEAAGDSVTGEQCRRETLGFLQDLRENGFLIVDGQTESPA